MRIVVDTNTTVSGLLWEGPPHELIEAAFAAKVEIYTSAFLLAELADVLARKKFTRKLSAAGFSVEQLVRRYARLATPIKPAAIEPVVLDDPDDDHVLACALAAKAEIIVSGDRHLRTLRSCRGIRIVGAAEAVGLCPDAPP